jgi:dienelactone hydrolase
MSRAWEEMATVVLFHSILGLRPAVHEAAARLRAAGHDVRAPDLFDGRLFETIEDGQRHRSEIGIPELIRRARAAADAMPGPVVYAGFSMGGSLAQLLAATRPQARAALLLHHAAPLEDYGLSTWPGGVPVQIHRSEGDPFVEAHEVAALGAAVRAAGATFEDFAYPGDGHLFADPGRLEYDEVSSARLWERALAFLA